MGTTTYEGRPPRAWLLATGTTVLMSKRAANPVPLRALRRAARLTQQELAARWGCSQSLVARMENSPLKAVTLRSISSYVAALGGSCHLVVELDGQETEIDLTDHGAGPRARVPRLRSLGKNPNPTG